MIVPSPQRTTIEEHFTAVVRYLSPPVFAHGLSLLLQSLSPTMDDAQYFIILNLCQILFRNPVKGRSVILQIISHCNNFQAFGNPLSAPSAS